MAPFAPHMRQVKASAGSGKTYHITERFLSLLNKSPLKAHTPQCPFVSPLGTFAPASSQDAGGALLPSENSQRPHSLQAVDKSHAEGLAQESSWGDIMAITFTNLAAKEMKERVLKSLKQLALQKSPTSSDNTIMDAAKAKAWIDIILRQYSALNIRTIDSLLHLIVRTSALDLGLAPDFESSFDSDELMNPIFDALLQQAEYGDAHTLLLLENICHSLLFHDNAPGFVMGKKMIKALSPLVDFLITQELPTLSSKEDIEQLYTATFAAFQSHGQQMLELVDQEALKVNANALKFFAKCANGDGKACDTAFAKKANLDACLNKASVGMASALAQKTYADLTDSCAAMVEYGTLLKSALRLYPFVELAQEIAQQITSLQNQEQKLPHAKIPSLAKDILEFEYGVSTALCRLGNALHHVLLDEFQDTSREQWDALRPLMAQALSQGGSFTWVGDTKQAIYGWRGGDAALFDEVLHEDELTCMCKPTQGNLPTNWRSREMIVTINNTLFSALSDIAIAERILQNFISTACPPHILGSSAQRLVNTFTGATQQVKEHAQGGHVHFEHVQGANVAELEEALYAQLKKVLLEDVGQRRPWGDVAILVRKNKHATLMAQWLLEWRIPAITEHSLLLHTHPLVEESAAFLHFLNNPQDDVHFWTVLTGSIVRCALADEQSHGIALLHMPRPSIQDLHNFIAKERHLRGTRPLYSTFKEAWPLFWEHFFAPFYGKGQVLSTYDSLQEWYSLWQVAQRFPEDQTFLRRFLEIVHGATQQGHGTLGAFLDYWEEEGTKEKAPPPTDVNAVHIMTVHKSKGLQFPVVIIPQLNAKSTVNKAYLIHETQGLRMLIPRSTATPEAYYTAQAEQVLEALNVFYVATTRAEEELYFFHTHCDSIKGNTFSTAIDTLFEEVNITLPYTTGYPIIKDVAPAEASAPPVTPLSAPPVPADISLASASATSDTVRSDTAETLAVTAKPLMQWMPGLKVFRNPLQELFLDTAPNPKHRGVLIHNCLEIFQNMNILHSNISEEVLQQGIEHAVTWAIQNFALPLKVTPQLQQELIETLHWYAHLPDALIWAQRGLAEQALMDARGKVYRADMLLPPQPLQKEEHSQQAEPQEQSTQNLHGWRVIEFKTGQENPKYAEQVRTYMHLLDALPAQEKKHPLSEGVLIYLDLRLCRMVYTQDGQSEALPAPQWQGVYPHGY